MPSGRHGFLLTDEPVDDLDAWTAAGGGEALRMARAAEPDALIEQVRASGLRGRGGAGFPTGTKWRSVRDASGTHRYAVCNAAEGEPATFKDRAILRANPYAVVEGLAIAAHAVDAEGAYIGIKESFGRERERLEQAVAEMEAADLLAGLSVAIVPGPDEYLFGEEKALLEVIEGGDPLPRLFPPYEHGLFVTVPQEGWSGAPGEPGHRHPHESNPTLVNNVETLANVPYIVRQGPEWFRSLGTEDTPGTLVCTVVGDVQTPGVFEVEAGTSLGDVVAAAGGTRPGRSFKAALSGAANAVITADEVDVRLSHAAMRELGLGLGAAGFAVYDDTACIVRVAHALSRFLWVESCNQCPACKIGSGDITELLERIDVGEASDRDIEIVGRRLRTVTDGNRCYLPVQERVFVSSVLRAFPEEIAAHLDGDGCPTDRPIPVPKLVDLDDGVAVFDERQQRKRPDWTYAEAP